MLLGLAFVNIKFWIDRQEITLAWYLQRCVVVKIKPRFLERSSKYIAGESAGSGTGRVNSSCRSV